MATSSTTATKIILLVAPQVLDFIKQETLRYSGQRLETGGILAGRWLDHETLYLQGAAGSGPRAEHEQFSYSTDANHANQELQRLARQYPGVDYVGEWHVHPPTLARPSSGDLSTARQALADPDYPNCLINPIVVVRQGQVQTYFFYLDKNQANFVELTYRGQTEDNTSPAEWEPGCAIYYAELSAAVAGSGVKPAAGVSLGNLTARLSPPLLIGLLGAFLVGIIAGVLLSSAFIKPQPVYVAVTQNTPVASSSAVATTDQANPTPTAAETPPPGLNGQVTISSLATPATLPATSPASLPTATPLVAPTATPLPAATSTQAPAPTPAPPPGALPKPVAYTVRGGDNLTRIAAQFSTTIAALRAANPTLNAAGAVYVGNQLVIPVSRGDYKGKGGIILGKGQTLKSIADSKKLDVNELSRFNGFASPDEAKPGTAVLLPG